jgi:uncharacterized protein involved in outer membrane biogenesis
MRRALKIVAWVAGIFVGLVVIAGGALYAYVSSEHFRTRVAQYLGDYSGRKTTIADIQIRWGSTAQVRMSGVEIGNVAWGKAPHMLKAEAVDLDIRLWPLLRGDVVLPRLVLRKPDVQVEFNDKELSNWSFQESPVVATAGEAVKPESRGETPLIGKLEITEGKLGYRDTKRKLTLDGTVTTATGKAGEDPVAELTLNGTLENQKLALKFVGGSALMLRDSKTPYPVDLDVAFGGTKLKLKGTLLDPFQWKGANVELSLAGPDLSEVFPLLGIPAPPTPPYQVSGKLDSQGGVWRFTETKWKVGQSDLTGEVVVDRRKKPGLVTAKLISQRLIFADLAPLVGAPPGQSGRGPMSPRQAQTQQQLEASGDLFPNVPLRIERLRAMNMDVTLDAKRVVAPAYLPVQALAFRVVVDNGRATAKPLTLALVGGGTIAGELVMDARSDNPRVSANLQLQKVELKTFFRESKHFDTTQGLIQGRVNLAGHGRSLAQVMNSADGHIALAMGGGSVSSLTVSLAGLQIADALALFITGDKRIPILCAVGRLNFQRGIVTFDRTLVDTEKSVLKVTGQVALPPQTLKIDVDADVKRFDLLDLHGSVGVEGKLRDPKVTLGRVIPIPTPVIGTAKTVDCPALTAQMMAAAP